MNDETHRVQLPDGPIARSGGSGIKSKTVLRWAVRVLSRLSGNVLAQRLLNHVVTACQALQGVGYGAPVASSGERSVLLKLSAEKPVNELCVFDVGANKGQFLAMALDALNDCCFHIHAFEPSIQTYQVVAGRFGTHDAVTVNNFALGRENGIQTLFFNAQGSGIASLTKRRLDHFGITMNLQEEVRVQTIDDYCRVHGIEQIDLLKIDVEEHELDVLAGAAEMLGKCAVRSVTFEFGGCNIDTRTFFRDFYYLFSRYGMKLARIGPGGFRSNINEYREIYEQFRTTNFVAWLS